MHIIGAGGHAKVIIDILILKNQNISGIWDDNEEVKTFMTFKLEGKIELFKRIIDAEAIVSIGNNKIRKTIVDQLNCRFISAIHPESVIANSVELFEGTVVMANVTVNSGTIIGRHVILNTNSSVDHDCKIGDFVHISPQVGLAGNVEVGEGTHVGIGACVIPGIKIGKWVTIGAGTVVIRDIPDYAVVIGNPGTIIRYNSKND